MFLSDAAAIAKMGVVALKKSAYRVNYFFALFDYLIIYCRGIHKSPNHMLTFTGLLLKKKY